MPLLTPGGPGTVSAREVAHIMRTADTGSDALRLLADLPRLSLDAGMPMVLAEVSAELVSQNAKWGEQNHPDGTGPEVQPLEWAIAATDYASELADYAKARNAEHVKAGTLTWLDILIEEVWEAFAEPEFSPGLRMELIQVAAVAVQWVLSIDRRRDRATEGAGAA